MKINENKSKNPQFCAHLAQQSQGENIFSFKILEFLEFQRCSGRRLRGQMEKESKNS